MDFKYIKSVIPNLKNGKNMAHVKMFHDYFQSPVHFTMDRNSQNDLILRGDEIDAVEYSLPYQTMSIKLNRSLQIGNHPLVLDTLYLGIVENVTVPKLDSIQTMILTDVANKMLWLQKNATTVKQVNDVLSIVSSYGVDIPLDRYQIQGNNNLSVEFKVRELLKQFGNIIINEFMLKLATGYKTVTAFSFFLTYTEKGKIGHLYDWFNTGSIDPIVKLNQEYFQDGFNNHIYDLVLNLIKGFTVAWKNKTIIERQSKPTLSQRRAIRRSSLPIRFRSLSYDVNAGSIVRTKTVATHQNTPSQPTNNPIKIAGHDRSETLAYTWVRETNVKPNETVKDQKTNKRGNLICKVLRPRKGSKVNGGSNGNSIVVGCIKSL